MNIEATVLERVDRREVCVVVIAVLMERLAKRDSSDEGASWLQDTVGLTHHHEWVPDVLENGDREDEVKRPIGERQRVGISVKGRTELVVIDSHPFIPRSLTNLLISAELRRRRLQYENVQEVAEIVRRRADVFRWAAGLS